MKLNFWLTLAIFHFIAFNFFYSFIHEDIFNEKKQILTDYKGILIMNDFSNFWKYQAKNSWQQQTVTRTISIDKKNLQQPHLLKIEASKAQLNGHISINNNRVIKIQNNQESIDLSPYLFRGKNIIEISGSYSPKNSQITIEFSGVGNQITQQSSGSGILKNTLIIDVR